MAIPGFQAFMLPLLRRLEDGEPHALRDFLGDLADDLARSESERTELTPSGRAPTVRSRAGWAQTYMKQAGLLTHPRRGLLLISDEGRRVLATNPAKIEVWCISGSPGAA
ncbi:MAG TPA: winged helix-turn-helix domain-containing protein [Candidatus Saccharimonadales bacterium]|nr:winged helix-turn-helix domain-containing protein [Candidatus Saccharimonadales bacterium]